MKKLKILPSILMLVLCVGVLAVGVFAITPTKNQIKGSITINAINAGMEITPYKLTLDKDGNETAREALVEKPIVSRQGIDIPLGNLSFNTETANIASDVANIVIAFSVKNTSSEALGMYFSTVASPTPTATTESIKLDAITTGETPTTIPEMVEASFSGYNYLPIGGTGEIKLTFSLLKTHTGPSSITLDTSNISLNITNLDTNLLTDGWIRVGTSGQVYRDYVNLGEGEDDKSVVNVIVNEGVTSIDCDSFSACTNLENLILPNSLLQFGDVRPYMFNKCTKLKYNTDVNYPTAKYLGSFDNPYIVLYDTVGNVPVDSNLMNENTKILSTGIKVSGSNVYLPDGIVFIGESDTFGGVTSISIPSSINYIGYGAINCTNTEIGLALTFRKGTYAKSISISNLIDLGYFQGALGKNVGWYTNREGTGTAQTTFSAGYHDETTYYLVEQAS